MNMLARMNKGGNQEIAAIVANMNQPDFSETFSKWHESVIFYPKAFDFRYESLTSIQFRSRWFIK
jgi:hypothetical protein